MAILLDIFEKMRKKLDFCVFSRHKYLDTINRHFELGLFRLYYFGRLSMNSPFFR
jgi:hypothetical protein